MQQSRYPSRYFMAALIFVIFLKMILGHMMYANSLLVVRFRNVYILTDLCRDGFTEFPYMRLWYPKTSEKNNYN